MLNTWRRCSLLFIVFIAPTSNAVKNWNKIAPIRYLAFKSQHWSNTYSKQNIYISLIRSQQTSSMLRQVWWISSQNEFKSWFMTSMHIQSLSNTSMIHNLQSRSQHPIAIFKCLMLGSWGNFAWARGQNLYPERMLSQFCVESYAINTHFQCSPYL